MSLRSSVLRYFVAQSGSPRPAHEDFACPGDERERACTSPAPRTPPGVAVLSAAADAQPLGCALGLALASRQRTAVVVVCLWTGELRAAVWRAPALPAARRLAVTLGARGLQAREAGRLAVVRLPGPAPEAAAEARRASAAAGAAPVVLALGGPRVAAFDALLAEQDLVVVATSGPTDAVLARLAMADLSCATSRVCACAVPSAHPARSLAVAGLTLLPSARRALAEPVEALS